MVAQPDRKTDGRRPRLLGPAPVLAFLLAAAGLLLVHLIAFPLLFSRPEASTERAALTTAGVLGLVLLAYGVLVAWRTLRLLRRSQQELTETRARLEVIIDASPLAITAADPEGRLTLWNRAAEKLFGWTADEAVGAACPAIPEGGERQWRQLRQRVLRGETVTDIETHRRSKAGRSLEVNVSAAPIRNHRGEVEGTIAVVADVTQRRAGEREREKLEAQLRQAQKMEAIGRLAGGVAHDFNNLLTAIKGHAELALASGSETGDTLEDLEEIARSADRASALTRQLLAFTRQSIVEPRALDLNQLIGGMEKLLRRLIGEPIELTTELASGLGTVMADPGQIEQVLMNLVVNARDAMPEGGRITLRTANTEITPEQAETFAYPVKAGPYVSIHVADTGTGMDEDTARQIFEPFFTTKPIGVGTGLGLSTAYGIIKQARGYIWVDSRPGEGTTFSIHLPRIDVAPERKPVRHGAETDAGGSETVLIVEDEEAVLSMARKTLERRGYRVLSAGRGQDAIRVAREHAGEIHLLFSDVVMPDLTGREVAERIARLRPEIRVLMTSGYAEHVIAKEGIVEPGIEFIPKPYTPTELATRVRELLEPGK